MTLEFSTLIGKDFLLLAKEKPRAALLLVFSLYFLKYRFKAKKLDFIKCSELNFACGKHSTKIQKNLFFLTHACKTLVCAPFTDSENGLFSHQCEK